MSFLNTPYPAFISTNDLVMLGREGGIGKTRRGFDVQMLGMWSTYSNPEVDKSLINAYLRRQHESIAG